MKNFFEKYPNFYVNLCMFICIFLFLISGFFGLIALTHPKLLIISEFIKAIELPSFLTSEKKLKWTFQGINKFFYHEIIYSQNKKKYKFQENKYIKCLMPHGIIPFTTGCLWGDPEEQDSFNWNDNIQVTSHQFHQFPFLNNYGRVVNMIPADYNIMDQVLKKKSLLIYPGGMREMFSCNHKKDVIVIKKRKGIFKLALTNGAPLLPIYTFGITSLYEKSNVKITMPFFFKNKKDTISWYYGKYYTLFPMRRKLITVVGKPLFVEKKDIVTLKDIEELRGRYIVEIKKLFNQYCTRKLKIK